MNRDSYLLIFDLDGVLINSKINMKYAWNNTKKVHNIRNNFKSYFLNIGMPFKQILEKLNVNQNQNLISKTYQRESLKNFDKIKLYKNVSKTIKKLKKKHKIAIVTSKDLFRTKKFLKNLI